METSILKSTKKVLGLPADYDAFDVDIVMHINAILSNLNQIGVGPEEGFSIEDETAMWNDFLGDDPNLNNVKSYVYLKVRLLFDPPQNSNITNAINEQIKEIEWRVNVYKENKKWASATPGI